ncbi:dienelactone hydrolase family protein [Erythrobacter sp. Alg231-14]|uniref:dienelactone hydrolase family protein n=1 Tax=Erythrobacter sp. Alg231-14 TaxID=1922225 RepID=UPI000D55BA32
MCDQEKLKEWAGNAVNRRQFGVLAGSAAMLGACAEVGATKTVGELPLEVTESSVSFETDDGTMDAFWVHPTDGAHPGVIFWPDIASLRESKRNMARRLASKGYSVLVLNPYYRDVAGEQFADFAAWISAEGFDAENGFALVTPWREKLTAESIGRDAVAAAAWLDTQEAVDTARGIGTQGYCMGGPFTVWSAAAVPDRIKAAASFHGGGLVRDGDPLSPHNVLDRTDAAFLIAVAQDDDASAPDDKTAFAQAAEAADRPAKVEVYAGDHGWTVPDSPSYSAPPAERAYVDLLTLYGDAL